MDDLEDLERTLRARVDAIGPEARAILLYVLKQPDLERARSVGEFYADPRTRTFANLLIDLEDSPHVQAVVLGELRERELRRVVKPLQPYLEPHEVRLVPDHAPFV